VRAFDAVRAFDTVRAFSAVRAFGAVCAFGTVRVFDAGRRYWLISIFRSLYNMLQPSKKRLYILGLFPTFSILINYGLID
jgi:hypothetical protein